MRISVSKDGTVKHSAMSAVQLETAINKSVNIVMTLGDNVTLTSDTRTIPATLMTGQPAQEVEVHMASGITVEGLDGERTINVTRILSQACPSCNTLKECASYLEEKGISTITVDIETLTQYNNAKRFSNIRLS